MLGEFPERYTVEEKLSIIQAYKKGGGVAGLAEIIDDEDDDEDGNYKDDDSNGLDYSSDDDDNNLVFDADLEEFELVDFADPNRGKRVKKTYDRRRYKDGPSPPDYLNMSDDEKKVAKAAYTVKRRQWIDQRWKK